MLLHMGQSIKNFTFQLSSFLTLADQSTKAISEHFFPSITFYLPS